MRFFGRRDAAITCDVSTDGADMIAGLGFCFLCTNNQSQIAIRTFALAPQHLCGWGWCAGESTGTGCAERLVKCFAARRHAAGMVSGRQAAHSCVTQAARPIRLPGIFLLPSAFFLLPSWVRSCDSLRCASALTVPHSDRAQLHVQRQVQGMHPGDWMDANPCSTPTWPD